MAININRRIIFKPWNCKTLIYEHFLFKSYWWAIQINDRSSNTDLSNTQSIPTFWPKHILMIFLVLLECQFSFTSSFYCLRKSGTWRFLIVPLSIIHASDSSLHFQSHKNLLTNWRETVLQLISLPHHLRIRATQTLLLHELVRDHRMMNSIIR